MLVKNKSIPRSQKMLKVREDLELLVSAIPVGVQRDYEIMYPIPRVPTTVTQSIKGERAEKENWNDPAFIASVNEHAYLKNFYFFYRVIQHDPNIALDNRPSDVASLRLFADEVKDSGLGEGEIAAVLTTAMELSGITSEKLEAAKGNF
jgi:hypothetical protein